MAAAVDVLGNCSYIALPPASLQSKALLLQSWDGLSEGVPDHSTICRFRNTLTKQGLLDALLLEVNRQLSAKGLYIKTGEVSIVDATVIETKQSRPSCSPLKTL